MTVASLGWSKAADEFRTTFLPPSSPLGSQPPSNDSWIHCHLIIFEERRDPSRTSGHHVSCHQTGRGIAEACSHLITLSERYQTRPICPTLSTHVLECLSHTGRYGDASHGPSATGKGWYQEQAETQNHCIFTVPLNERKPLNNGWAKTILDMLH